MEEGVFGAVWEVWEGGRGNNGGMEEEGFGGVLDPHMVFPVEKNSYRRIATFCLYSPRLIRQLTKKVVRNIQVC